MKLQYLGDSRDSFKWDYHDYLTSSLSYPLFNVALMMTPDDKTNEGSTKPHIYKKASSEIINLCRDLKKHKDVELITQLPSRTNADYEVALHKDSTHITNNNRREYFSDITCEKKQVFFLDPDNGFEPEKKYSAKHVLYSDIENILGQISEQSIISVFQYFRRVPFPTDFARIRQRLISGYASAIYWHSLMFVAISKSEKIIDKVRSVNRKYSQVRPVIVIQ
ncbi:MAG: hypothetical protein WBN66_01075 [Smithella sp.]